MPSATTGPDGRVKLTLTTVTQPGKFPIHGWRELWVTPAEAMELADAIRAVVGRDPEPEPGLSQYNGMERME